MSDDKHALLFPLTRRDALGVGAGAAAGTLLPLSSDARRNGQERRLDPEPGPTQRIETTVNDDPVSLEIDLRASLLDLLRERRA